MPMTGVIQDRQAQVKGLRGWVKAGLLQGSYKKNVCSYVTSFYTCEKHKVLCIFNDFNKQVSFHSGSIWVMINGLKKSGSCY